MADSWREQWKRQQQQRAEQQEQRRRQQQQREQQQEQARLDAASEYLHQFVVEMMSGYGLTEEELRMLLDVELEWYAADLFFIPT